MDSQLLFELLLLVGCYLFGSIPFSVLLGKNLKGVDVRKHGSGNPGGTNSIRWLGKPLGLTIIFLDGLKGGLVILLIRFGVIDVEFLSPLLFGVMGAFGHVYPVFLKFKGGKAVAAMGGLLVGYNPIWAIIAIATFFTTVKISKYVSIGSTSIPVVVILLSLVCGFAGLEVYPHVPDTSFVLYELPYLYFMFLMIVFRHSSNYDNIKNGVEPKVGWAVKQRGTKKAD